MTDSEHVIGCHDCGLIQTIPPMAPGMIASCAQCQAELAKPRLKTWAPLLALTLTALVLAVPAFIQALFAVAAVGIIRKANLGATVSSLTSDGYMPLAAIVAAFALVIPLLWLGGLAVTLTCLEAERNPPWLGRLFRYVTALDMWAMPEIFLLGGIIAYSRLQAVASVGIEIGGWAYIALSFAVMMIRVAYDRHTLWEAIGPFGAHERPNQARQCPSCSLVIAVATEREHCPRCATRLYDRKPHSITITTALVIASFLLYIPANILPVLSVLHLGRTQTNTILGGALELVHYKLVPLAIIIFVASIVLPMFKLFGLSWFLISIRRRSAQHLVLRTRLHRIIALVGRWSNVDVFVIALLDAFVRFGRLTSITPMPGAFAFAAVVVLTMIASNVFDSRLMWDAVDRPEDKVVA